MRTVTLGVETQSELTRRILTLPIERIRGRRVVAIAGGAMKVAAIRAVLASGLLSGLITDERTARAAALVLRSARGEEIVIPCITTWPSLGISRSARQRSRVVLPEPDGPTMQTTSRSVTARLTLVST